MSAIVAFLKNIWKIIHDFFSPSSDPADVTYDQALEIHNKYKESRNLADLISALDTYKTALQLRRSNKDQTDLASLLVNYAVALWSRYQEDPEFTDDIRKGYVKHVIELDEEARTLWKANPPEGNLYPTLLTNLATAYFELFHLDPPQGLTQSLALSREVFDNLSYPEGDHYTAALMIGKALLSRYELNPYRPEVQLTDNSDENDGEKAGATTDTLDALDEAIAKFKESLGYANKRNDPQIRMACYYFIAKTYDARYGLPKQTGLDSAIDYNRKAREILPENDPKLETCLYDLCRQLLQKYDDEKKKNWILLEEAKVIATQRKFQHILDIIHNRENRKATWEDIV